MSITDDSGSQWPMPKPWLAACLLWVSCNAQESVPSPPAAPVPAKQFTFEDLHIEERRGEQITWSGTARRADGDLGTAHAEDVHLVCAGQGLAAATYDVYAPAADLDFEQGKATFTSVQIQDRAGGILQAIAADYDQATAQLVATGPLQFSARGLVATAARAVVHLNEGRVEVAGPVQGRYLQPPGAAKSNVRAR